MKILIVHERFPPDYNGGGEYVMLRTAQALQSRGVEIRVLTTGDPSVREFAGIPTLRLPISRYRLNFARRAVAEEARDVDAILTATYHGCLPSYSAGKDCKKPVICIVLALFGDVWKTMRPPLIGEMFVRWERFLLTRPFDRWIFLTEFSRQFGLNNTGIPAARSTVASPGIELPEYAPAKHKENVVFVTGKLDKRKGIFEVMAAARELPHVRFRIMGWGDLREKVEAQSPSNVEFLDYKRGQPLRAEFGKARIFLFPTRGETMGVALIEAMASGCAVISSVPLPFDGLSVAPGDVPGIVQAVRELWNDPERCRRMGAHNRELAQEYSWEIYTDRLMSSLQNCLAKPLGAAG